MLLLTSTKAKLRLNTEISCISLQMDTSYSFLVFSSPCIFFVIGGTSKNVLLYVPCPPTFKETTEVSSIEKITEQKPQMPSTTIN